MSNPAPQFASVKEFFAVFDTPSFLKIDPELIERLGKVRMGDIAELKVPEDMVLTLRAVITASQKRWDLNCLSIFKTTIHFEEVMQSELEKDKQVEEPKGRLDELDTFYKKYLNPGCRLIDIAKVSVNGFETLGHFTRWLGCSVDIFIHFVAMVSSIFAADISRHNELWINCIALFLPIVQFFMYWPNRVYLNHWRYLLRPILLGHISGPEAVKPMFGLCRRVFSNIFLLRSRTPDVIYSPEPYLQPKRFVFPNLSGEYVTKEAPHSRRQNLNYFEIGHVQIMYARIMQLRYKTTYTKSDLVGSYEFATSMLLKLCRLGQRRWNEEEQAQIRDIRLALVEKMPASVLELLVLD